MIFTTRNFLVLGVLLLASCRPSEVPKAPHDVSSMAELEAPESFTYSTWTESTIDLYVDAPSKYGRVVVQVFGESSQGKELLHQTVQAVHDTNSISFKHGAHYRRFVASASFSDGQQATGSVKVGDKTFLKLKRHKVETPIDFTQSYKTSSSDCSDCAQVISNATGSYTVSNNDTLCLGDGGSDYSVVVNPGGYLKLCGSHNSVGSITLKQNAGLILSANSSLTFASGSVMNIASDCEITVYENSVLTSAGALTLDNGSKLISYGTLHLNGHLEVQGGANFTSFGTTTVKGHVEVLGNGTLLENYGSLKTIVNDHIRVALQGRLVNHCHLHSDQHIWIEDNGRLENYNQIDCDHKLKMNDGGVLELKPSSISIVQDLQLYDAQIVNLGLSTAVLKIWDDAIFYKDAAIGGMVDICAMGLTQNQRFLTLSGNARFDCGTQIPPTACITIGHYPGIDEDGDGVVTVLDPFPLDSSRVSKICEAASTLVFEDNWPYQGDYDFNDVVMSYQIWGIANRQGKLKDIYFAYKLRARGAAYENGFGIEFNTSPANLISPDYEQENTLTTSALVLGQLSNILTVWNTDSLQESNFVDIPWDTIVFTFQVPIHDSVLSTFNPFLVVDQDRGREVHLPDHKPTPLANMELLGQGDDASNTTSGDYYHTAQNQPWALQLPVIFDYPFERVDITQAYINFDNWATSGGFNNLDWYDSSVPTNIKSRKVHKRNK